MLFNSLAFAVFLPIVFIVYWAIPHKCRWFFLLASSYYFYMSWNAKYILLILLITIVSYGAARLLENEERKSKRNLILGVAVFCCLGTLLFFKYFNFFGQVITDLLSVFTVDFRSPVLNILLPVGISFYTFQAISYVIDVYRKKTKPEHHFGIYATFISFFPQLVAGPIERTENLLPQIRKEQVFDYTRAVSGLKLMAWGFYKKIVIADTVSQYVDIAFAQPQSYQGFDFIIAMLFFTVQIYCDFSGYSDIAVGTARLMGIELMSNFGSPYFSASVKEFWSRWHISLSAWFKDYVYIPLGGNRCNKRRHSINLLTTFLASGLWHGADWTFVVWGGLHGVAQIFENIFSRPLNALKKKVVGKIFLTCVVFCFCNIAWVFFRAESIGDAIYVITHMFEGIVQPGSYFHNELGLSVAKFLMICVLIGILALYDYLNLDADVIIRISNKNIVIRWSIYIVIGLMIIFMSRKGVAAEFVYFQF